MKELLKEWYSGNFAPCDHVSPKTPEYFQSIHTIDHNKEYFKSNLPPDEYTLIEELSNSHYRLAAIEAYENFRYGFRLGIQLLCESLLSSD